MKQKAHAPGKLRFLAVILLFNALSLDAQDADAPLVSVGPIVGSVLSESERESLERMVSSYVAEILDSRDTGQEEDAALEESSPPLPDISITGEVAIRDGDLVFTLGSRVGSGESAEVSEACVSVNEIVLRARELTMRLLSTPEPEEPVPAPLPEGSPLPAELSALAGTWRGDRGLDKVRIYQDGRAVATLINGVAMALSVSVEGSALVFSQAEESSWRFYQSTAWSMATAREIAGKARPARWIMLPSADGKRLEGRKESSAVSREADGSLIVDNEYSRSAVWERLF